MTAPSKALLAAQELLKQYPMPVDAEQQLEDLEQQARPDEHVYFADIWEAFIIVQSLNSSV